MNNDDSSIERLKRTLYSRDERVVPKERRTPVSSVENSVKTDWGTNEDFKISLDDTMTKKNNSFFNKFLLASSAFFLVSMCVALFIFFGGFNMVSSDNLTVEIVAPSLVASGEELLIGLSVVNGNRTDLDDVTLYITYPTGVKSVNTNQAITFEKIVLGTIVNGGREDYAVRSIVFGEKDSIRTYNFRIEYKVVGSNATFSKEKTYEVVIGSSPVLLNVTYPKEINSGQEVAMSVDITSNSSSVIKDTLLKIEYPYGFTYIDSNVKPIRESVWSIGDLKNGEKKTITLKGTLVGQNNEDRTFRISAGTQNNDSLYDFDTTLVAEIATVGIRKSFFDLAVSSSNNNIEKIGTSFPVEVEWQNTLPDKIINAKITLTLSGNVLDRGTVVPGNAGYYRSGDNVVLWDKNNLPGLSNLNPGDMGRVSVSLSSYRSLSQLRGIKNPNINVKVQVEGDRAGIETGKISSEENIVIKFPSTLGFTSKSFRSIGPLTNSGPVPPKADVESTYTVSWVLTNTTSDLKDVVVSATLPLGVEWKSNFIPANEKITYDADSRVVYWNVGNVASGSGFEYSPKEVNFKLGITPSLSQVGSSPALLMQTNAAGHDTYTDTPVSLGAQSVTTYVSDPGFNNSMSSVIK